MRSRLVADTADTRRLFEWIRGLSQRKRALKLPEFADIVLCCIAAYPDSHAAYADVLLECGLTSNQMANAVAGLRRTRLIRERPDPVDLRRTILWLTAKGKAVHGAFKKSATTSSEQID